MTTPDEKMQNFIEDDEVVVDTSAPSCENQQKIKKLSLPMLILTGAANGLQLLSMIILIATYCRVFRELGAIGKAVWLFSLAVVFLAFMIPSLVLAALIFTRQQKGIHFSGRYQAFHISTLVLSVLSFLGELATSGLMVEMFHLTADGCEWLIVVVATNFVVALIELARAGVASAFVALSRVKM